MADEDGLILPACYNEKNVANHTVMMLEQLNVQRYYGAFCDVTIQIQEAEFRLHKCILAAASSQLQTMMYSLRDSNTNILTLREVSLIGFRCIVDFIYTGLLKLDSMCVEHTLSAAQFFELRSVEKSCLDFIKSFGPAPGNGITSTVPDSKVSLHGYRTGIVMPPNGDTDSVGIVEAHPQPTPSHIPPPIFMLPAVPQHGEDVPPAEDPGSASQSTHPPATAASQLDAPQTLSQPPLPPPHPLTPFPLPQGAPMQIPPTMPYPNTAPTITMDTNYIEDYLKIIESMQSDQSQVPQPPSLPHPSQTMTSIGPSLASIHTSEHTLHPPPPLYLQHGIGFGAPPPPAGSYAGLKETHMSKQVLPHPLVTVSLSSLQVSSAAPTSQLASTSVVPTTRQHTFPSNPNSMGQYSAEDVRRTILNVLSQEKFDDDEDDNSKGETGRNPKEPMSLTTLLSLAPIHRSESPKSTVMGSAHFEDISEIEEISNAGDDVDVEVDDNSSLHEAPPTHCDSKILSAHEHVLHDQPSDDHQLQDQLMELKCASSTPGPDEEIQVDDCEPVIPLAAATVLSSDHHHSPETPVSNSQPPSTTPHLLSRPIPLPQSEDQYYHLQSITPPTTPTQPQSPASPDSQKHLQQLENMKLYSSIDAVPHASTVLPGVSHPVSHATSASVTVDQITMATDAVSHVTMVTTAPVNHVTSSATASVCGITSVVSDNSKPVSLITTASVNHVTNVTTVSVSHITSVSSSPVNYLSTATAMPGNRITTVTSACVSQAPTISTGTVNINNSSNPGLVQIIITGPPVTQTIINSNTDIHRDPSLFSRPLKKRIKMQVKKKLFCDDCGREFHKQETLQRHKASHTSTNLASCHICGHKFSRSSELTRHLRTHTAELYSCWLCNSQFSNSILFKQHMVTVHAEKKPFYCVYPGCSFRSHKLSNVERHASIHSENKTFMCFQCNKSFAQSNGLRSHLRSCLQQRGYLCDLCGAKFNYLQSLKSHRLLHTGEKPNVCSDCGATFTDARNLRRHKRIHENVFPYPCQHCDKKFRHSNTWKAHLLSHEKKEEKMKKISSPAENSDKTDKTSCRADLKSPKKKCTKKKLSKVDCLKEEKS